MKIGDVELRLERSESWPKGWLMLTPPRLPYPMSEAEAVRWLAKHSVLIVDLQPDEVTEKP